MRICLKIISLTPPPPPLFNTGCMRQTRYSVITFFFLQKHSWRRGAAVKTACSRPCHIALASTMLRLIGFLAFHCQHWHNYIQIHMMSLKKMIKDAYNANRCYHATNHSISARGGPNYHLGEGGTPTICF